MCNHTQTSKHFKTAQRFDKEALITWVECTACHMILGGGVSLQEPFITPVYTKPVQPVVQKQPVLTPAKPEVQKPKAKAEPVAPKPLEKKTILRESNTMEEDLEDTSDKEDSPFTEVNPEQVQKEDYMTDGEVFLKESRSSIKARRRALRKKKEAMKQALKEKKAGINPAIPFLEEPDRASKEDEYN